MRVDVNVSVRENKADGKGSKRVEVKNVSGAINVGRVVEHEFLRHIALLEKGDEPLPETRKWDAELGKTFSIRDKDSDPDYRFFLDPDLPRIKISEERKDRAKLGLPQVPFERKKEFCAKYGISVTEVKIIFKY